MRKVGYFFFSFVPMIIAIAVQFVALFFLYGTTYFTDAIYGANFHITESSNIHVTRLLLGQDFQYMIMVIYSLICICIFSLWYYARYEGEYLPSAKKTFNPLLILSIFVFLPGAQFGANIITALAGKVQPSWIREYEELTNSMGVNENSIILLVYGIILAPIAEELIFRAMTLRMLKKAVPFWAANLIQALCFGLFHMNWMQGLYTFALGLLLGYVCEKGRSIYYAIGLHILFNIWGLILSRFIVFEDTIITDLIICAITVVSLALGFVLFILGQKRRDKKYPQ